jgi:hypothetical protein
MTATVFSDDELRQAARERIARLFNVSPDDLPLDYVFGEELQASFVSDWKPNEFDRIYDDICDVSDRKTWNELSSKAKAVRTVGDYCEHMVRCYRAKPKEVIRVLFK